MLFRSTNNPDEEVTNSWFSGWLSPQNRLWVGNHWRPLPGIRTDFFSISTTTNALSTFHFKPLLYRKIMTLENHLSKERSKNYLLRICNAFGANNLSKVDTSLFRNTWDWLCCPIPHFVLAEHASHGWKKFSQRSESIWGSPSSQHI